jgi:hypothetical protein
VQSGWERRQVFVRWIWWWQQGGIGEWGSGCGNAGVIKVVMSRVAVVAVAAMNEVEVVLVLVSKEGVNKD